jgi:hypothetical protein
VFTRLLEEGYGPGAWHGADLKAALDDVTPALAFWRPAPERHNIAEIVLHHAWCARSVRGQLSGTTPEPFVLEGEDWFELRTEPARTAGTSGAGKSGSKQAGLSWTEVTAVLASEQQKLSSAVAALAPVAAPTNAAGVAASRPPSSLSEAERFDLVLGITCHAIYHAGQIQLLKRLHAE